MAGDPPVDIEFEPGIAQITSRISSLPDEYIAEVLEAIGDHALGVLKDSQPRYKYVSRAEAYPDAPAGPGWFSDRQRRYVMGAINRGEIVVPYHRTGEMAEAWIFGKSENTYRLSNTTPGVEFVMGDQQARQPALVGWKKASAIVAGALTFRSSKFRKAVQSAYQRALRKVYLG